MSHFTICYHLYQFFLLSFFLVSQINGAPVDRNLGGDDTTESNDYSNSTENATKNVTHVSSLLILTVFICISTTVVAIAMIFFFCCISPAPNEGAEEHAANGKVSALDGEDLEGWDVPPEDAGEGALQEETEDEEGDDDETDERPILASKSRGTVFSKGASRRSIHSIKSKQNKHFSKQSLPQKKNVKRNQGKKKKKTVAKMQKKSSISRQTVTKPKGLSPHGGEKKKKKKTSLLKVDKKVGRKVSKGKLQPKKGKGDKKNKKKGGKGKDGHDTQLMYNQGVQYYKQFLKSAHSVKSVSQYFK